MSEHRLQSFQWRTGRERMAQIGFQIPMLPVGSIQSLAEYIEIIPGVIAIKKQAILLPLVHSKLLPFRQLKLIPLKFFSFEILLESLVSMFVIEK